MSAKITRKFLVIVIAFVLLLSSCNWLDGAVSSGIDKGFGNDKPCSGIVC